MIAERVSDDDRDDAIAELRGIPGVGQTIANDLYDLGYRAVEDLRGEDPEAMYSEHCRRHGVIVDRCLLYTFRCAVYFAETAVPDPAKLKWWNWKDTGAASRARRRLRKPM